MSTTYTPTPTNVTSYTAMVDGDGPGVKAADARVYLDALADKIAYVEGFKPVAFYRVSHDEAGDPPYADQSTTNSTSYSSPGAYDQTIAGDFLENDLVIASFEAGMMFDDATTGAYGLVKLEGGPSDGSAFVTLPGAKFDFQPAFAALKHRLVLTGESLVSAAGEAAGAWRVRLTYKVTNVAATLRVRGPWSICARVYRAG